jgi:hypothetical protein
MRGLAMLERGQLEFENHVATSFIAYFRHHGQANSARVLAASSGPDEAVKIFQMSLHCG